MVESRHWRRRPCGPRRPAAVACRSDRLAHHERYLHETQLSAVLRARPKDLESHVAADVRGDGDRCVERPPRRAKDACAHETVSDLPSRGVFDTPVDVRLEGSCGTADVHGSSGRRTHLGRIDGDAVARRLWNAADVDDDACRVGEHERPPWPLVVESETIDLRAE